MSAQSQVESHMKESGEVRRQYLAPHPRLSPHWEVQELKPIAK